MNNEENSEKNIFDDMEETDFEDETETPETVVEEQVMVPEDLVSGGYTYLKNPDVGESVEFEVAKLVKRPGRNIKKKDGGSFDTGFLNKKTGERTEYILESVNNERFTITSWGLFYNLLGKDSEFQKKATELGNYAGIKVKITHVYNGKDSQMSIKDLKALRGLNTDEEAESHKKVVADAIKNGGIYKVEILN